MTRVKTMVAVAAVALSLILGGTSALAFTNGGGNSENAPGQQTAVGNCGRNIDNQTAQETTAGGGPKEGIPAPTNCDHFFQNTGAIGNQ
jgi:hypothetical protein